MECKFVCQNEWYGIKSRSLIITHLHLKMIIVRTKCNDNRITCIDQMICIHYAGSRTYIYDQILGGGVILFF